MQLMVAGVAGPVKPYGRVVVPMTSLGLVSVLDIEDVGPRPQLWKYH